MAIIHNRLLLSCCTVLAIAIAITAHAPLTQAAPTVLTDKNFASHVAKTSQPGAAVMFTMFYAPWCGHCKRLEPTWEKLAEDLKGQVNVAKLDCTVEKKTAGAIGVTGYPTLYLISNKQKYRYQGERSSDALTKFALGGYKTATPEDLPEELTLSSTGGGLPFEIPEALSNYKVQVVALVGPLYEVYSKSPMAFAVASGVLVSVGMILGVVLFSLCCKRRLSQGSAEKTD